MRKNVSDGKRAKLNAFAKKWKPLFETAESEKEIGRKFARECRFLGFDMDSGLSFSAAYGDACHSFPELEKIIGGVTDVKLLCSGIISNHRFITHWSDEFLYDELNRQWFAAALSRLEELTR